MQVRRVQAGDVKLAVAEAGEGGRPILLVHGFTGGKEDFNELLEPLAAAGWHAAAPDLRGHGASDYAPSADGYSLETFVADGLGVADALGWDEFVLAGHSMGGAVAQRLALDHPARVRGLVLLSTFHGPLEIDPALLALGVAIVTHGGMEALAAALAAQRQNDPAAVAARERMERARPGYGAWADGKLLSCSADMWLAMAPRFPEWPDTLRELSGLDVPTLIVVGGEDETMRAQSERMGKVIPRARLVVMEGIRHSPQIEAAGATWAELDAFLRPLL